MAIRRIEKELAVMKNLGDVHIQAAPVARANGEVDLFTWKATIVGPSDSPYQSGKFALSITIPRDYPFRPPAVHFDTRIYHPNISSSGAICLGLLKTEWNPAVTLSLVLSAISAMLAAPNPDDPLEPSIAEVCKSHPEQYQRTAAEWTERDAERG